ncbi:LptF/LptG family permease [Epilithonimonas arachidiradicis]|uniref:Lipopolysaccharide export system permease protein n=1 Tax=Epilithonimonas arachidiradicis TaxID=1617282 RepID=A0A420DE32_9FLAO|nr:LptF/LptG family permease [Epilithonimonas arachidiradicis]RKE89887.1 lipopolysaccharide export system permease protein [Epilithonimonas arachidiradicis]GGG46068.1 membrane protein [Epilithonimonas arachidiradicis]
MKIIDLYVIKKYLGTLIFMLALLSIIVLVVDVQSKTPRIESNGFTVGYFLLNFYPFWILNLVLTFMSILVFITVIFFTSRMANNTEIVAVISSGASFHRFAKPYLITSILIACITLALNHFILPWSNIKKNVLEPYTYNAINKEKLLGNMTIASNINPSEYIFVNSYNKKENRGSGYMYQRFDKNKKLIYQITAMDISWDAKKKHFVINNYVERTASKNNTEILGNGTTKIQDFKLPPSELFPDKLVAQNKTTPELLEMIKREKMKGNNNVTSFYNELYQRTSMPVSIIILTFLGLSLSSQKKRGGLGLNLALGIALAFLFVFSFQVLNVVSENKTLPPLLAMWLPNIVFAPIAAYLYIKRANE